MTAFGTAAADVAPSFVDVRGRKTQVLRSGSGPALLYLHSAAGDTWWSELDDDLARDFDVIHPALPGFEGSEGLAEMDDALDVAFHVLDLLDALALDRVALVGSSLGGWVAAEAAVLAPERITSLVLACPAGIGPPPVDMFATEPAELARLMFASQDHWLPQLMSALDLSVPQPAEIIMPLLQSMEATARVAWNPYLYDPKLPGRLHRVRARTLVVRGEQDGFMPARYAEQYASLIPGARLESIPACGHLPALERPAELAALVRAHLG